MDSCSAPSAVSLCLLPAARCSAGSGACKHNNQRRRSMSMIMTNMTLIMMVVLIELYIDFIRLTAGSGAVGYLGVSQSG